MAQPYTTGPVNLYVAVSQGNPDVFTPGGRTSATETIGQPVYLGTMLEAPKHRTSPKWSPLINDLAGDQEPYDMAYQGKSSDIFGDLTVWNWPVLDICMSLPNPSFADEGLEPFGSVGTLMITEGFAYQLWLDYPYYRRKSAFSSKGAPAGYHYFAAWMIGPMEEDPGTKPNKIHVQFHAMRVMDQNTGDFRLRNYDMSAIPLFPPTASDGVS